MVIGGTDRICHTCEEVYRMPLSLVQMGPADFARRRGPLIASYARAIENSRRLPAAQARAAAELDVAERLPRGPATRGHLLRKALVGGAEVGWIWVSLPGTSVPEAAWINDIEVDPEFRSRGYAGAIITAAEAELAGLGVARLGLNVFGDNGPALRLYQRLGFEVTAQQYGRSLTEVTAPDGIELVPMADYESRIEALFADYAQDLVDEQGLWHGEAEARAARKLSELLPHGARTEGMILRTVLARGVPVGWVWAGLPESPRPHLGWLHNIEIDEPHRGRGHGSAAIAAIEAELARRDVPGIGLNVHGSNVGARRLYQRLGYQLLAQQMARQLPAG
ncbi:GNAT family N-acetyltransferase [Actinoplanes sp. NPDC049599]|uniref:GNAT family N-acetyltransferase n=1 Tax=Actinoplanes sp. NPDC049599 TaxID=3363903 RepID=UPI0037BD4D9D